MGLVTFVFAYYPLTFLGGRNSKEIETQLELPSLTQLSYDPKSNLFELDADYLVNTGLLAQKLVLYCRPTFHEQCNFLKERVIDNGVLCWILGPPGTGKSTTTLAFASSLDRNEWIVTWIQLSRTNHPLYVLYDGVSKTSHRILPHEVWSVLVRKT
jgi:hypothetical protein